MRCCLCTNHEAPHVERRYTGRNGEQLQPWAFCEKCYQDLRKERADHDPWIAARYVVFLEFLAGRYKRRISRRSIKAIVERNSFESGKELGSWKSTDPKGENHG